MYYTRPTFIQEVVHFLSTMFSIFWRQTSAELDSSCVLVVMDVIEAYEPLYSDETLEEINNAINVAHEKQCKVIFTRWTRCRKNDVPCETPVPRDDPGAPRAHELDAMKELKQKLQDYKQQDDEMNGDKYAEIDFEELLTLCDDIEEDVEEEVQAALAKMEDPADSQNLDEIDKKGHWSFFIPQDASELLIEPGKDDIVVDVRHTNAFMHSGFREHIDPGQTLVFTGAWAESCIINTVRSAVDRNIKTAVIKNACSGHTGAFHFAMFVLQSFYTTVYSTIAM